MTPVDTIVQHAQAMARRARRPEQWRHGSLHELLLAHGRLFEPAPLPDTVYPALAGHSVQAAAILSEQRGMPYVEGLALLPNTHTVIEHAWCTTWLGQVVDPGLGATPAAAYLGIAFTLDFRRQAAAHAANRWSVLLPDHDGAARSPHRDILQHGLPSHATVPLVGTPLGTATPPTAPAPHTSVFAAPASHSPWTDPQPYPEAVALARTP